MRGRGLRWARVRQPLAWRLHKAIERECDKLATKLGFDITRLSQARRSRVRRGLPDRYYRHRAWQLRLWVEIKTEADELTEAQATWLACERESGGLAVVVRSDDDLLAAIKAAQRAKYEWPR